MLIPPPPRASFLKNLGRRAESVPCPSGFIFWICLSWKSPFEYLFRRYVIPFSSQLCCFFCVDNTTRCELDDDDVVALADEVEWSSLKELSLAANGFGDRGAEAVLSMAGLGCKKEIF